MRRLLISTIVLTSLITTQNLRADCNQDLQTCRSDGQKVIKAAQDALKAKDDQISAQTNTITDLQKVLADANQTVDADTRALAAWYHNPIIVVTLGILVGAAGSAYLLRK